MKTKVRKNCIARGQRHAGWPMQGQALATALTGVFPAEADIHYSGRVDVSFPANENKSVALPLDQTGDSIIFERSINDGAADFFGATGLQSGKFLGSYPVFSYAYVWRIKDWDEHRYISQGHFHQRCVWLWDVGDDDQVGDR